jgi:chloride channel protein, CIC family
MRTSVAAVPIDATLDRLTARVRVDPLGGPIRLYPVVSAGGKLDGVVTRFELRTLAERAARDPEQRLDRILRRAPTVAHPDEPLRVVVHRMAETGLTSFPVVERGGERRLVGMISLEDLLKARTLNLDAERRRERVMRVRLGVPFTLGSSGVSR